MLHQLAEHLGLLCSLGVQQALSHEIQYGGCCSYNHEELTYYMHTHGLIIEFALYEVVYILYQPAFTLKIPK